MTTGTLSASGGSEPKREEFRLIVTRERAMMGPGSNEPKSPAEKVIKDFRREKLQDYSVEEKIRTVLERLRVAHHKLEGFCTSAHFRFGSKAEVANHDSDVR